MQVLKKPGLAGKELKVFHGFTHVVFCQHAQHAR